MNGFVDYLNSMNNANSDTAEALAESQVLSAYYEKIQIQRKLGSYIANRIRNQENITVVLTGHAGDGKTSILVQVLRELELLPPDTPLEDEKYYSKDGISVYAVKDMSELPEAKQIEFCRKALNAPKNGHSAIVISNTGPLLKCLEALYREQHEGKFDEAVRNHFQSMLLSQLDSNRNEMIGFGEYKFLMINIARVDNVCFAEKALKKIIADEMWQPCENCPKKEGCHIRFNVRQVQKHCDNVSAFINAFYRYLYENDMRMTIRQMLSQLCFAVTGNHSCGDIKVLSSDTVRFNYLFSNLFFGYSGYEELDDAEQIQGISYAKNIGIDSKGLSSDYRLFVTGDLKAFPSNIRALMENQQKKFSMRHLNTDEEEVFNDQDREYRKAIRRAYIIWGQYMPDQNDSPLYDELFGAGFNDFRRLQQNKANHALIKRTEKTITDALYLEMTGTSSRQFRDIPLTIKRNDDSFQSVMLTKGSLKRSDLKIHTRNETNEFEDISEKYGVYLRICGRDDFPLTLPMLIYFREIADGVISTMADPALTHGISKLKTLLQQNGSSEDDVISVIVNQTDESKELKLFMDEGKLYIE